MSRRRRTTPGPAAILFLAGLSATLMAVRPAAGQDPTDPADSALEARFLARLDSLHKDLNALADRVRNRNGNDGNRMAGRSSLDTFTVRGVQVITPDADAATVRPWVDRAAKAIERRIGRVPPVADPPTVRVDWAPFNARFPSDAGTANLRGQSANATERTLENAIAEVLTRRLPDPVRGWLQSPVGVDASAHVELATSPVWVVRECRDGDTGACAVALGVAPLDTAALTPVRQRELDALLAGDRPPQLLPGGRLAFLLPDARRGFLNRLLRTRPGALERLLAAGATGNAGPAPGTGPAPDAGPAPITDLQALLVDAADGPLAPILEEWRTETLARTPAFLPASMVGATLLWIILFLAFATRSTRWRAG